MSPVPAHAILGATTLLVACAPGAADPPRLSGHFGRGSVEPSALRQVEERPDGAARLGELRTRCRAEAHPEELDHVALADVDCSETVLLRALYARAAEIGADLLVAPACDRDTRRDLTGIVCHAGALRSADGTAGMAGADRLPELPAAPFAVPEDAFRVSVTARLAPTELPRPALDTDSVSELAFLPPNRVVRADVVARGEQEAGRDAVRYALRAAAGRLGATDIVGIACVSREHGTLCVGHAARTRTGEMP